MSTYEITIFDGHVEAGTTDLEADSFNDAETKATKWAQTGDWDHPGTVRVRIVAESGEEREIIVDVGEET